MGTVATYDSNKKLAVLRKALFITFIISAALSLFLLFPVSAQASVAPIILTFVGNGGRNASNSETVVRSVEANQIVQLTSPLTPDGSEMFTRSGCIFGGWGRYAFSIPTDVITSVEILNADVTLYAVWITAPDVRLTFNGNGGWSRDGINAYLYDFPANLGQVSLDAYGPPADYFRLAGYNFVGWSQTPTGIPIINTISIDTSDVSVYAIWLPGPDVNMSFDGNGGTNALGNSVVTRGVIQINQTLLLSNFTFSTDEAFVNPGYEFAGWTMANDPLAPVVQSIEIGTSSATVYAKWESIDHTVYFYDGSTQLGARSVASMTPINFNNLQFGGVLYNADLSVPGKGNFIGWLYYPAGSAVLSPFPADLLVYNDLDLYAHWSAVEFTVTYETSGAGPGSAAPIDINSYSSNTYARVLDGPGIIPPAANMMFIGWRTTNGEITYYPDSYIQITGDTFLYPYFVMNSTDIYITFDSYSAEGLTYTMVVTPFSNITLPDDSIVHFSNPGHWLAGWTEIPGDLSNIHQVNASFYVTGNITLYANWIYTLSFDPIPVSSPIPLPDGSNTPPGGNAPAPSSPGGGGPAPSSPGGGGGPIAAPTSTPSPKTTTTPVITPTATPTKTPTPIRIPKPQSESLTLEAASIVDESDSNITVGVKLQWRSVIGVYNYDIYRSTNEGSFILIASGVSGNLYVDVGLDPDTKFSYIICPAGLNIDDTNASNIITVTTGPTTAPLLKNAEGEYVLPNGYILMQINDPMMNVNGEKVEVDPGRGTAPMLVRDRTMLPIRAVVEAMDGAVDWDPDEWKVALSANGSAVVMWIGQYEYSINGMNAVMDIEPFLENERTFLPLRFVAESLNCRVTWINATMEILIVYRRTDNVENPDII